MNARTKKFLSYYRPYRRLFLVLMLCALLAAGISLLFPLLTRHITKTLLDGSPQAALVPILQTGGLMLLLALAYTALSYFVDYRGHALGAMMEADMRAELFAHYQTLPFHFFDGQRTGQLMSRISNDLLLLAELYHHGPEDYLIYSLRFAGALAILLAINPLLTLSILLFLPPLAVFILFFTRRMNAAMRASRERIGDVNAQVEDNLSGIRVVKSFANEALEIEKFNYENGRFLESRKTIYRVEAQLYQGIGLITQAITITVVVAGGLSIVNARLDLPDLIAFLMYTAFLIEPIQKLGHMTQQFQEGITGFDRFMEMMAVAPEEARPESTPLPRRVRGRVTFRGVSFRYSPRQPEVLKNIDLDIQAGETVALVGSSGVGKTTLCSLIPRFYEVTAGVVLLDEVDIRTLDLGALRRSVGVVQQDVYLFAGTVLENIRYGRPDATQAEVEAAARRANAHEFIQSLPDGYDTDIGQRGVRLSGGQKQRLSIARVFLKDPPVLIFDEATSALDSESERVVQEALAELAKNRTTFIIAHRLSTVQAASRIVVLTGQGIEAQGSHAELLAQGGTYARLYRLPTAPAAETATAGGL